jgi:CRP-like cAMP-binding protein
MAVDQIAYAYVTEEETYPETTVIIHEGVKNDWVYVILEGNVKIRKKTSRGQVTLATLKEGDILGEMAFLALGEGVRSVSAVASDGPVRVGLLDTHRLVHDYEAVSPRIKYIIRALIKRLQAANDKLCEIVVQAK